MNKIISYNLHDILYFKIETKNNGLFLKDTDFPYSYFETQDKIDPDIYLKIGKFIPKNQKAVQVDHQFFIKDNYFYCRDNYLNVRYEVEIFGFEKGKTRINFSSNIYGLEQIFIPNYLAQYFILRPLIEIKLVKQGYCTLHGLALEKNGKAYIFPSRDGAHKTRLAMDILKQKEYRVMGDDRIIIDKVGRVYSFPIFWKLLFFRATKMENEFMSIIDKIKLLKFLNSKKDSLIKSNFIVNRAELEKIIFISRRCNFNKRNVECINSEEAAIKLTNSLKMEFISREVKYLPPVPFLKHMLIYSYIYPESSIARYWISLKELYTRILTNKKLFQMDIPDDFSFKLFKEYTELLEQD